MYSVVILLVVASPPPPTISRHVPFRFERKTVAASTPTFDYNTPQAVGLRRDTIRNAKPRHATRRATPHALGYGSSFTPRSVSRYRSRFASLSRGFTSQGHVSSFSYGTLRLRLRFDIFKRNACLPNVSFRHNSRQNRRWCGCRRLRRCRICDCRCR